MATPISNEIKIFYRFLTEHSRDSASKVMTATATICEPKYLATDANGKCHAFVSEPIFDSKYRGWLAQDKYKVFVFTLPKQVLFSSASTLAKLSKGA